MNEGGVDASIPLSAGKFQQTDPLEQIGKFANLQNALNSNKIFPLEQQRRQQEITLGDQAIQGGKTDLQTKMNQAVAGLSTPLLALPSGGINHANFTDTLASIEKNYGIPTNGILSHVLRTGPQGDGPAFDAAARAAIAAYAQPAAGAAAAVTPHTGPVLDVGPNLQPTTIAPQGSPTPGAMAPAGGSYSKGLSPGEATAPTQIGTTAAGAPVVGTRQQFIDATGGGASPLGTGRLPSALRGPNAAAPGVVTGVGPAQQSALSESGSASAKAFNDITDQGVAARSQGAVLDNMLADTSQFTTGPGANTIQRLREVGQRLGFPVDKDATSASESFNKLASQLANAQGAGSDARLAVNQSANPHSDLSPGGVDMILRQLRGNADYLSARQHLAAGWGDSSDRKGFEDKIGASLDPRVFQYVRMTPEQKSTFLGSVKDKGAFKKAYGWADSHGLIGGSDGAQ